MEQEIGNQGYVVEGRMTELTRGFLVLWTIASGQMTYARLCELAQELDLTKNQIPELRTAKNAFAYAKEVIRGASMEQALELEGWDGPVTQTLNIARLQKGNEYQISIKREGRMNGKRHVASVPILRLEFSPPENVDYVQWVEDYQNSFWDEEVERPELDEITRCVAVTPYWEDTTVDPTVILRVRNLVVNSFRSSVTSIDSLLLRSKIKEVIFIQLNGIAFLSGKGAVFVPKTVNGKNTSTTLESYANLLSAFAGTVTDGNYYNEDGSIRNSHLRRTNLRYLGYLDGDRELEYIRDDISNTLSAEVGEHWAQVVKLAESFNEDNIEAFEKRLSNLEVKQNSLKKRIKSITDSIGGDINVRNEMHPDLNESLNSRIQNMPTTSSLIISRIRLLAEVD